MLKKEKFLQFHFHVISNRSHIIFPKTRGSLPVIHATLSGWVTHQCCKRTTMQHGW